MPDVLLRLGASLAALWLALLLLTAYASGGELVDFTPKGPTRTPRTLGTIKVGIRVDNYPYSFRDADGTVKGFSVDLLHELGRLMGLQFEEIHGSMEETHRSFREGRLDMVVTLAESKERSQYCDFSIPYLPMTGAILMRTDAAPVSGLEGLRGKQVLLQRGSVAESTLIASGVQTGILYTDTIEDALLKLDGGYGDATLASRLTALALIRRNHIRNVQAVGAPIQDFQIRYCFGVRPGDKQLLSLINEGLAALNHNAPNSGPSAYDRIYAKWFGFIEPAGYSTTHIAIAIAAGLALALAVAIWAVVRQRTMRKRIAKQALALRESEERYRSIFESSLDGIVVLGRIPRKDNDFLITAANCAALRIFGQSARPGPGTTLNGLLQEGPDLSARIAAALLPGNSVLFEYQFKLQQKPVWVHVSVAHKGNRLLLVMADITEAKLAEARFQKSQDALRQAQKLEAIGTLASGIAHDFNNILTGIIGNAQLAQLDIDPKHPARPNIEEILKGSERAKNLVRQILTFSRKAETKKETVRISPLIKEALNFLRSTTPSYIEIRYKESDKTAQIQADPTQIYQVLTNLCTNAVHAMNGRPGHIEIAEAVVTLGAEVSSVHSELKEGSYFRISVRDTGSGMPPEVLEHLFEPFFTTKGQGEGTGLGLAVVHGIVRNHGGVVTVYSQVGQGAVFNLYFPLVKASDEKDREDESRRPIPLGGGETVVLLDDEETIVSTSRIMLEKLGYKAKAFANPEEAEAEILSHPQEIYAVVTDLTMPKLSGIDFARKIRLLRPGLPVILASGYIGERDYSLAHEAGVSFIVDKPYTFHALGNALAACKRSKSQNEPQVRQA